MASGLQLSSSPEEQGLCHPTRTTVCPENTHIRGGLTRPIRGNFPRDGDISAQEIALKSGQYAVDCYWVPAVTGTGFARSTVRRIPKRAEGGF